MRRKTPALGAGLRTKKGSASKVWSKESVSSLIGQDLISPTRHSEKPRQMYDLIESRSNGPYLELFARKTCPGWDAWGDEAETTNGTP